LFAKPSEIFCHEIYCHLPKSSTSYCINKTAKTRGLLVLERDPFMPVSSHRYLKFVTAHCRGAFIQIQPWRHLAPSLTHLKFHIPLHQLIRAIRAIPCYRSSVSPSTSQRYVTVRLQVHCSVLPSDGRSLHCQETLRTPADCRSHERSGDLYARAEL
jgi:hypothetical protein